MSLEVSKVFVTSLRVEETVAMVPRCKSKQQCISIVASSKADILYVIKSAVSLQCKSLLTF